MSNIIITMTTIIENMEKYMFNNININKILLNVVQNDKINNNNSNIKILKKNNTNNNIDFFYPERKDKLFWCFYYILFGKDSYDNLKYKNVFKVESDTKIDFIKKVREKKNDLKKNKITRTTLETELMSNIITINTIKGLCIVYKKNIMYVWDNKYYDIVGDYENDNYEIIINENNMYKLLTNEIDKKRELYLNNYWKVEDLKKPLKSIANYKIEELKDICKRLNITIANNGKTKIKKELYEDILTKL